MIMDRPIVLISQLQRSGGTLLSQLFDGHSQVLAYPRECELLKGGWPGKIRAKYIIALVNCYIPLPQSVRRFSLLESDDVFWRQFNKEGYKKFSRHKIKDKIEFGFDFRLRNKAFRRFPSVSDLSTQRILNAFFSSFFEGWTKYKDEVSNSKKVFTAFSPGFCYGSIKQNKDQAFFNANPDGHILSIVRDPSSWLNSAVRHSEKYKSRGLVDYYIPSLQASLTYKEKFPDKVTLILFENLIKNTEEVMKAVCDRIEIDFEGALLSPTYNGDAIPSNSSFSNSTGKNKDVLERSLADFEDREGANEALELYNSVKQNLMGNCIIY
jgi:hypothetical protein